MAPINSSRKDEEITHEFVFFRAYKDGRVQMKPIDDKVPPYDDPLTGVHTKDTTISYNPKISARIFKPKDTSSSGSGSGSGSRRLPLVLYVHGNGFCRQIAFTKRHHIFLTHLADEANAIFVTFTYGGFPDRPIESCYDDSWKALRWVLAHSGGDGREPWLNSCADFGRFFICGNSSGANISHTMASRIGREGVLPPNVRWVGLGVIQPVLAGCTKTHDDMWEYMSNGCKAMEDPRQNPTVEDMKMIRCDRILVAVGGDDEFKEGGIKYFEALRKIGWRVDLEISQGQTHSSFLFQPNHEATLNFIKKLASFINKEEEANPSVQVPSKL